MEVNSHQQWQKLLCMKETEKLMFEKRSSFMYVLWISFVICNLIMFYHVRLHYFFHSFSISLHLPFYNDSGFNPCRLKCIGIGIGRYWYSNEIMHSIYTIQNFYTRFDCIISLFYYRCYISDVYWQSFASHFHVK